MTKLLQHQFRLPSFAIPLASSSNSAHICCSVCNIFFILNLGAKNASITNMLRSISIHYYLALTSNVNLDHLTQINSRMMNSLMMLICAIFIIMLIILIYHRQKTIDSSKDEYFFLYENGLSIKELKSLARYDYVYYYVFYLVILLIISILMSVMMHIPIILYACLLWFFSILLEEFITTLCIHKVGRLKGS